MLEDDYCYVVRKALKGHGIDLTTLAKRCMCTMEVLENWLQGARNDDLARKVSAILQLKADALIHHASYLPKAQSSPSIHRIDLPFRDERVNAWLIWTHDAVMLFDTGFVRGTCMVAVDAMAPPRIDHVWVTHGHVDHIGGLTDFSQRGLDIRGPLGLGVKEIKAKESMRCGSLEVRAWDLSGHANPALGYQVLGLKSPVWVVGDALFAGSIGGCASPALYRHALARLHAVLDEQADDCVLLPGHGPATTLGEERAHNPFW
ncbi:MAG: MBL fold metallo-hydrolase [Verrucomicrobia bacterium]|nr:MAG: MBL fold metallo-hydrolase [Verrucomicrobiota bacterium]